ncbi:MAG: acyltransferase [Nibricoccus sp.]
MKSAPPTERIEIIDALRGLAALGVCWFHFTRGTGDFFPEGWLNHTGAYGFFGVHVFFVVSGFVIPFTLVKSSYQIRSYFRFLARRIVRLDPPYFVSILLVLGVGFALMRFTNSHAGQLPYESLTQLLLHLGYINALFDYKWLSPIYWTLAIEFQYYLMLGLVFPLLFSSKKTLRFACTAAICAFPFLVSNHSLVFRYLPWFLFGIYACYLHTKRVNLNEYAVALALLTGLSVYLYDITGACVLLGTSLLIAFYKGRIGRILAFFGTISYSLYLTHVPVGCTLLNLSDHFHLGIGGKCLALAAAWAATIAASYAMYRLFEKPALKLASRIRYRSSPAPKPNTPAIPAALS